MWQTFSQDIATPLMQNTLQVLHKYTISFCKQHLVKVEEIQSN